MGCTNPRLMIDGKVLKTERIILTLSKDPKSQVCLSNSNTFNSNLNYTNTMTNKKRNHNKLGSSSSFPSPSPSSSLKSSPSSSLSNELIHAQTTIQLITALRNKIIYLHDRLVFHTGAFLFQKPTIVHIIRCIFFKMSAEVNGDFSIITFDYKEDPPYLENNFGFFSIFVQNLIKELFEFIVEIRNYRVIIKQIDQEIPELFYLVFERKNFLSKDNYYKIKKSIELFKEMTKLRLSILQNYKTQIYRITSQNLLFWEKVIAIGKYARKKNITNIDEIVMLNKYKKKFFEKEVEVKNFVENNNDNIDSIDSNKDEYYGDEEGNEDNIMFGNIAIAKKNIENKLKEEILTEEEENLNKIYFGNFCENQKNNNEINNYSNNNSIQENSNDVNENIG